MAFITPFNADIPVVQTNILPGNVIVSGTLGVAGLATFSAGITGTGTTGTLTAGTGILGTANTWTAVQTFGNNISIGGATFNVTTLAAGALIYYNGTNWLNLAIGTTGQVLTVVSGEPAWAASTGAVSSVSNSDGTLTISPTTGAVVASLALAHANTWTGLQTFGNEISLGGAQLNVSGLASGQVLQYNGTNWVNVSVSSLKNLATTGTSGIAVLTTATTVLTSTPATNTLLEIRIYLVSTAATTITCTMTYTDPVNGATTLTIAAAGTAIAIGVTTLQPFMINAATTAAVVITATGAATGITAYATYAYS